MRLAEHLVYQRKDKSLLLSVHLCWILTGLQRGEDDAPLLSRKSSTSVIPTGFWWLSSCTCTGLGNDFSSQMSHSNATCPIPPAGAVCSSLVLGYCLAELKMQSDQFYACCFERSHYLQFRLHWSDLYLLLVNPMN